MFRVTPELRREIETRPLQLAEPESAAWGFGEVFAIAGVFAVAIFAIANAQLSLLGDRAKAGYWQVAGELVAYLAVFAALKILFFWARRPLFRSLGWVPSAFGTGSMVWAGLGLFFVTVALEILLRTPAVSTPFEKLLAGDPVSHIAIAVFGITLGPAVEELLFRGFLQPVMVDAAGVFPGILLTSAAFGALHLAQNAGLWQSGVLITVAGFGFGTIRHISGSTRASTVAHMAFNSLPFLATFAQSAHK